jgi:hypothetical protein
VKRSQAPLLFTPYPWNEEGVLTQPYDHSRDGQHVPTQNLSPLLPPSRFCPAWANPTAVKGGRVLNQRSRTHNAVD